MTKIIVLVALLTIGYSFMGGLIGYWSLYVAKIRCEHHVEESCSRGAHGFMAILNGTLWPISGAILLGREIARVIMKLFSARYRQETAFKREQRERRLAEEASVIAEQEVSRKEAEIERLNRDIEELSPKSRGLYF